MFSLNLDLILNWYFMQLRPKCLKLKIDCTFLQTIKNSQERKSLKRRSCTLRTRLYTRVPVAQWFSIALAAQKVVGSIPREHILMKMYNLNAL